MVATRCLARMLGEDFRKKSLYVFALFAIVYLVYLYTNYKHYVQVSFVPLLKDQLEYSRTFSRSDLSSDVCWYKRYRRDWRAILNACELKTSPRLISANDGRPTDARRSSLDVVALNKAGSFSYLLITSADIDGRAKKIGGDSWRLKSSGEANVSSVVVDNNDGTYWVQIRFPRPGRYKLHVFLDYTLCRGLEDPPENWFARGNSQGKYQRMDIPPPLPKFLMSPMSGSFDYDVAGESKDRRDLLVDTNKRRTAENRILLVYGDSVSVYFAQSIIRHRLCTDVFRTCEYVYNWIYPVHNVTVAKLSRDDADFNASAIIGHLATRLLLNETFNRRGNALILNWGLHFVESTSFQQYQDLLWAVVKLLQGRLGSRSDVPAFLGTVVWRTTTSIDKERATLPQLHWRRFFTNPRIKLYNAFTVDLMCNHGIPVADVFPISDSFPQGAGTHASIVPATNDIVHYNNKAFYPLEDSLAKYLNT